MPAPWRCVSRTVLPAILSWALLPAIGGCTRWPEAGAGGMAEMRAPAPAIGRVGTLELEALHERLACSLDRLGEMREIAAARGVLAGRFAQAEQIAVRAQREYYGGLIADSARTLDQLDAEVPLLRSALPVGAAMPRRECT